MNHSSEPWILGVVESHNGSACLLKGNAVIVAVQEERLSRIKRQRVRLDRFALCIQYCLNTAGISAGDLDIVAVTALSKPGKAIERIKKNPQLEKLRCGVQFIAFPHHLTHAAYGASISGEKHAAVLVADGMGSHHTALTKAEKAKAMPNCSLSDGFWESVSIYEFSQGRLQPQFKQLTREAFPPKDIAAVLTQSDFDMSTLYIQGLGGMYERASVVIFGRMQEGGKVMGLASYGRPTIPVSSFHSIGGNGKLFFKNPPELDISQFPDTGANIITSGPPPMAQKDLAASVQSALEHGMLHYAGLARSISDADILILSGGVALNGVANERIIREAGFKSVVCPPAVEDCGNAIGAAFLALWQTSRPPVAKLNLDAAGRTYDRSDIDNAVKKTPLVRCEILGDRIIDHSVDLLMAGEILGWFQGGSELGPRALGQRSLLCDPRPADAKDRLNERVKRREGFRPFAPIVLEEHASEWFDFDHPKSGTVSHSSPFMTRVVSIRPDKRKRVPAVTHVDGTGRYQTVTPENGAVYDLIQAFYRRTRVPLLLNTSFNLAGEPVVETPGDALFDLLVTDIDGLVIKDRLIRRIDRRGPGILDLIPVRIAKKIPSKSAGEKRLDRQTAYFPGEETMRMFFNAVYPQGEIPVGVTRQDLEILMFADGMRSGFEIGDLLNRKNDSLEKNGDWLETRISRLYRTRIIGLMVDHSTKEMLRL